MDGKVEQKLLSGGMWEVKVKNLVDEDLAFPTPFPKDLKALKVDFSGVTYLNSAGIRNWILWLQSVRKAFPSHALVLSGLTLSFVRAIETISAALPPYAQVTDFYYDYFCPQCSALESVKVENHKVNNPPAIKCKACNVAMELEIFSETYSALGKHSPA